MKAACEQGQSAGARRVRSWRLIWVRWNQGKCCGLIPLGCSLGGSQRLGPPCSRFWFTEPPRPAPRPRSLSFWERGLSSRPLGALKACRHCAFQPHFLIISLRLSRAVITPVLCSFLLCFQTQTALGVFFPWQPRLPSVSGLPNHGLCVVFAFIGLTGASHLISLSLEL